MNKVLEILGKHIDEEGLVKDFAKEFILPKLEKMVADTDNKFDDAALAAVKKALGL